MWETLFLHNGYNQWCERLNFRVFATYFFNLIKTISLKVEPKKKTLSKKRALNPLEIFMHVTLKLYDCIGGRSKKKALLNPFLHLHVNGYQSFHRLDFYFVSSYFILFYSATMLEWVPRVPHTLKTNFSGKFPFFLVID